MIEKRRIGKSDIVVTPMALGCWPIAGVTSLDVNDSDSLATIGAALDEGINFLDTAFCYGADGESERLIAKQIAGRRDQVVIASKGGIQWDDRGNMINNARPEQIVQDCETSLKRLGTDVIDLYYLHSPDTQVPVSESAEAFVKLREAGKIRLIGASNFNLSQLMEFHEVCPLSAVQARYNMLLRDLEKEIIPWCQQQEIGVFSYWPLMKGLLAGKIRRGHAFDPDDKRLTYEFFQGEAFEQTQCLIDELDIIAAKTGKTVAQIVVNWSMHRPGITSTLVGAKRDWQIRETAEALAWQLEPDDVRKIDALAPL